jgi:predicted nuclease of predicted toxin-antitoxin system
MNFKLDENFGARAQEIFRELGHDADTVVSEGLGGATDNEIYRVRCEEGLCLVTLDLDFSDVVRFPPETAGGIVVIRCPRNPSLTLLERMVRQFLTAIGRQPSQLGEMTPAQSLWIVEVDRIRVHQSNTSAQS